MIKLETPQDKRNYWFKKLIEFIQSSKYEKPEKEVLINKIITYYLNEKQYNYKCIPFEDVDKTDSFFAYLNSSSEKIIFSSLNECVDISSNNKTGDFINKFIRYMVINNMEDISINCDLSDKKSKFGTKATITLGEYRLAQLELYIATDIVMFGGVEVNKNTRRLGLGTTLFEEVMSKVHEVYPKKDLLAYTVFKDNIEAIEFYKSLGATIEESIFEHCYSARFKAERIEKAYQKKILIK